MIVPDELQNLFGINDFESQLYITKYMECAPSKIPTNVVENLLVIVLEGKKKLICGDYTTVLSKGEFGFFRKGNYIMNQILTNGRYESLLVFISNECLREIKQLYDKNRIYKICADQVPYVHGIMGTYMQNEAEQITKLLTDKRNDYHDILKLKTRELLMFLFHDNTIDEMLSFINSCLSIDDDIKVYMESNYTAHMSVTDIANALHMSVSTFKRRFADIYSTTPRQWINNQRFKKAKYLIENTDYLITDICFLCGYESLSTFNSQFKKISGSPPTKIKKQ
ncbi:MAG TPA: AraC family transcriptional regulator [Ruminiclostridium sp.]|nr:AraC family transcriptional regulator [Ruminiclostridium sp.]